MLPKKGRREIVVDGVLYHYIIRSSIIVVIRNSITGDIINFFEDRKPKWEIPMKSSDIESIIRNHYKDKQNV